MFKLFATNVVVSKGYNDAPALKFSEAGDTVRFRIGKKVYDPNAENHSRWINMPVKAFGKVCERIGSMKLGAGSFLNLIGRLDEDIWTDAETGTQRKAMVIVLDDVEYAGGGKPKEGSQPTGGQAEGTAPAKPQDSPAPAREEPEFENFTGYEAFGVNSFFS